MNMGLAPTLPAAGKGVGNVMFGVVHRIRTPHARTARRRQRASRQTTASARNRPLASSRSLVTRRGSRAALPFAYVGVVSGLGQSGKRTGPRGLIASHGNARLRMALWVPKLGRGSVAPT